MKYLFTVLLVLVLSATVLAGNTTPALAQAELELKYLTAGKVAAACALLQYQLKYADDNDDRRSQDFVIDFVNNEAYNMGISYKQYWTNCEYYRYLFHKYSTKLKKEVVNNGGKVNE